MSPVMLLLFLPVLGAVTELLDVAAARCMPTLSIMLAYRVASIVGVVPLWFAAGRPVVTVRGSAICAVCAAIVLVSAPLYYRALAATTPTTVAVVSSCSPLLVMVMSRAFFGEPLSFARGMCIAGAIACTIGAVYLGPVFEVQP